MHELEHAKYDCMYLSTCYNQLIVSYKHRYPKYNKQRNKNKTKKQNKSARSARGSYI